MDPSLRNIFLPLLFISIAVGYQIFIYFIYQYYKAKKEKLELGRILLAYGLVFGLTLTGMFIRVINLYFIDDTNYILFNFLTKITFLLLYSSLLVFFVIISSVPFHKIVNSNLTKTIALLIIVPIISVFLLQVDSIIFVIITTITLLISYMYILFFHSRIVKLSTGDIKKRLNLILFGFALCLIQHFIGGYIPSQVLFPKYSQLLQIVSAPIFISGLMIVFLGVFRFPAFLEFGWKNSLLNLFIINKNNYNVIYSFNFKEIDSANKNQIEIFPKIEKNKLILTSGIIGIEDIVAGITESDYNYVETIKQEDFIILLNHGDNPLSFIIYCLIVNSDLKSYTYLLKTIKKEFQRIYKNILNNLSEFKDIEEKIFLGFDDILQKLI
ncbi:MAG: hypothetical protein EU535_02550 [Promethearchaeota archaeon]|nr:MAG: hypothetical protein EU535_02550 [Candidatus Lokiarchaeota archaeon]